MLEGRATREGVNLIAIGYKYNSRGNCFALFVTRMLGRLSALTSTKRNGKTQTATQNLDEFRDRILWDALAHDMLHNDFDSLTSEDRVLIINSRRGEMR